MSGYYPQYHGGAGLILDALRSGRLEWIRVADPRAGATDDLQIGTPGRVDAYQFKWSQFPGSFIFRDLTAGDATDPPLVATLADGWTRLQQVHPARRVVVHLRTNDQPSVNDKPGAEHDGGARHFSAFVQREWIPRSSGSPAGPQSETWRSAWRTLEEASGLTPAEFDRFVRDCRLEFGMSVPGPRPAETAAQAKEEEAYRRDLDALNIALQRWVIDPRGIVELSREELVAELGWQERLEFRSVHRFPDSSPYHEITVTARALDAALTELSGGYIILLGTPGSGKSTLLSNALRYRRERVLHYYAFVPDTPNAHRGESVNFLHDIVLDLSRSGFPTRRTLPDLDVEVLSAQFREQLRAIGGEHRKTGRKTVLVVDGLDHILREQDPSRALLRDLPEPSAIPEGVYLVLGSQTDSLPGLPAAVKVQIEQPARRIQMALMEPGEVITAVAAAGLQPEPNPEEARRIWDISGGHPLALAYVLNRLRSAGGKPVAGVLDLAEPFGGEIAVQYRAHWEQIADDFALVRLLALLARVRGPIRKDWVEGWAAPEPWHRLHLRFGHYFRREHSGHLRFFHNSFRAFLLERTRGAAGLGGPAGDARLYAELAEYSRGAPEDSPVRWDEIHYQAMARDVHGVAAAATRSAVTEQFFAGRAPGAILEDIRLALSVVGEAHDEVLLARLLLLSAEFERRTSSLGDVSLEDLLFDLSGPETALTHARDDRRLLTSPERAFALAGRLQDLGWQAEAALLFSLAEPVDLLSGRLPVSGGHGGNLDLLVSWAETAPRFRPLAVILRATEQLRVAEARGDWDRLPPHVVQARMRLAVSHALASLERVSEWEEVVGAWNPSEESDWKWWFSAYRYAWQAAWLDGQRDRARDLASRASAVAAQWRDRLGFRERVALANAAILFGGDFDAARTWVEGLGQPAPVDELHIRGDEGIGPYEDRFALNRILGALGDERPLTELVPDRASSDDRALSLLERQVALVGRLWGRAWRDDRLGPASFIVEIGTMLRLVRRDPRETGGYWASRARPALHALLIRTAAEHGPEVLRALRDAFEREWQADETGPLWSPEQIRDLLLGFVRQDDEFTKWARVWLARLEPRVFEAEDVEERVSTGVSFARVAAELGDVELGRRLYRGVLESSFGLARKDHQMSSWVELAARANIADPDATPERLSTLIGYSTLLDVSEDENTVLTTLLRLTTEWNLAAGIRLLEWDLEKGLLNFPSAVAGLLDQALVSSPELVHAVSALCRHVVLNLDPHPSASLVRRLAGALVQSTVASADEQITILEQAVLTCARASQRARLLAVLADVRRTVGLPVPSSALAPPAVEESDGNGTRSISLVNEEISLEEAQRRATDVESVREMLRRAAPGAYHRWGPVVEPLVAQLDAPSASALAEMFQDVSDAGDVLTLVARRLAELGAMERAWKLAKQAFTMTRPLGWVEYYDGGVRRRAVEVMVAVDPARGRALAWETLVSDVASGNIRAQDPAWALPWILPLFSPAPDEVRVWNEVDEYLSSLFAHARPSEPPRLESDAQGQGAIEILLGWAARYLDHPTVAVGVLFRRAFVDMLLSRESAVHSVLDSRLREGPPSDRRAVLLMLRAVAEVNPNLLQPMVAELRRLRMAADHVIRSDARTLLDQLGEQVVEALETEPTSAGLGLILTGTTPSRIHLPPRGGMRDRQLERGEPLPMTADPVELTGSIERELRVLSHLSGLQREVLQYRAAEMMRAVDPNVGSPNEERSLMARVRSAGLDLGSFRRPRATRARDALFRLIVTLEDEGWLGADELQVFDESFRYDDPSLLRQPVSRRPACVPPLPERRGDEWAPQDWTDLVSTSTSALQQPEDEWVVLAEWSKLRWLDWKRPTEVRFGVRLPTARVPLTSVEIGPKEQCLVLHHVRVAEYPDADVKLEIPVVFNNAYRFDAFGHGWLAINPALARHLGWSPDLHAGLFRWRSESGEIASETVWWTDGFPDLSPPHFEEEVGTGWLVRISRNALAQLETALGPLGGIIHALRTREDSPTRSATGLLDAHIFGNP